MKKRHVLIGDMPLLLSKLEGIAANVTASLQGIYVLLKCCNWTGSLGMFLMEADYYHSKG